MDTLRKSGDSCGAKIRVSGEWGASRAKRAAL
jgi:hypothetical protein